MTAASLLVAASVGIAVALNADVVAAGVITICLIILRVVAWIEARTWRNHGIVLAHGMLCVGIPAESVPAAMQLACDDGEEGERDHGYL